MQFPMGQASSGLFCSSDAACTDNARGGLSHCLSWGAGFESSLQWFPLERLKSVKPGRILKELGAWLLHLYLQLVSASKWGIFTASSSSPPHAKSAWGAGIWRGELAEPCCCTSDLPVRL